MTSDEEIIKDLASRIEKSKINFDLMIKNMEETNRNNHQEILQELQKQTAHLEKVSDSINEGKVITLLKQILYYVQRC